MSSLLSPDPDRVATVPTSFTVQVLCGDRRNIVPLERIPCCTPPRLAHAPDPSLSAVEFRNASYINGMTRDCSQQTENFIALVRNIFGLPYVLACLQCTTPGPNFGLELDVDRVVLDYVFFKFARKRHPMCSPNNLSKQHWTRQHHHRQLYNSWFPEAS